MIHVYVWMPRPDAWGHCAMYIERETREESRYVSWWPRNPGDVNLVEENAAIPSYWSQDVRLEGRRPDLTYMMNLGDRTDLDEAAMVRGWDAWKREATYYTFNRNCCTTVAHLLREPGGALAHSRWQPVTWWGPRDIAEYLDMLNRHFPVVQPLVVNTPPDID